VVGWLGTFCWNDTCRDSGDGAPEGGPPEVSAVPGGQFTLSLAQGTRFAGWTASYSRRWNRPTTALGQGGDVNGLSSSDELVSAVFPAPPPGDWFVYVRVDFAGADASYAWAVTVP
jgi:hypothetical protein